MAAPVHLPDAPTAHWSCETSPGGCPPRRARARPAESSTRPRSARAAMATRGATEARRPRAAAPSPRSRRSRRAGSSIDRSVAADGGRSGVPAGAPCGPRTSAPRRARAPRSRPALRADPSCPRPRPTRERSTAHRRLSRPLRFCVARARVHAPHPTARGNPSAEGTVRGEDPSGPAPGPGPTARPAPGPGSGSALPAELNAAASIGQAARTGWQCRAAATPSHRRAGREGLPGSGSRPPAVVGSATASALGHAHPSNGPAGPGTAPAGNATPPSFGATGSER